MRGGAAGCSGQGWWGGVSVAHAVQHLVLGLRAGCEAYLASHLRVGGAGVEVRGAGVSGCGSIRRPITPHHTHHTPITPITPPSHPHSVCGAVLQAHT